MWIQQRRCSPTQVRLGVNNFKNSGKLKIWVRQVMFLLNIYLLITIILVQSGALRQENQKKERHSTTKAMSSAANKMTTIYTISWKYYFPVSSRQSFKRITAYVWHKKWINEQFYSIPCAKNKMMVYRLCLNNRISCVVGISSFGFMATWKRVLFLMDIKTRPTFKQLLQVKIVNANKKKS